MLFPVIVASLVACLFVGASAEAFESRFCLGGPQTVSLCEALQPVLGGGLQIPPVFRKAVEVISRDVLQRYPTMPHDQDVDQAIYDYITSTGFDTRANRYCDSLTSKAGPQLKPIAITACLRPICLLSSINRPSQCARISSSDARALLIYSQQAGEEVFGKCRQLNSDCQYVSADTAELVVAVDTLWPFFRQIIKNIPKCAEPGSNAQTCSEALPGFAERGLQTLERASAMYHFLSSYPKAADKIDKDGAFRREWSAIAEQEKSLFIAASGRIFPWDPEFFLKIIKLEPMLKVLDANADALLEQLYIDSLVSLWTRGEGIVAVADANPELKNEPDINQFVQSWRAKVPSSARDDTTKLEGMGDTLRDLEDQLKLVEANLANKVKLKSISLLAGHSADSSDDCRPSEFNVNWERGTADACFTPGVATSWLSGLRFAFAPCAAGIKQCLTTGDIRVLLPVTPLAAGPKWIAVPTGIAEVPAEITEKSVTLTSLAPARPIQPDPQAVMQWLQRMLPRPLQVIGYTTLEVADGPEIRITDLRMTIPSLNLPDLVLHDVTLGPKGLSVVESPGGSRRNFDIGLRSVLASSVKSQKQIGTIVTSSLRLMDDDDINCGASRYILAEYPYGFCTQVALNFASVPIQLQIQVLVDRGGQVVVRPAYDPATISADFDRALAQVIQQRLDVESIAADRDGLILSLQGPGAPPCQYPLRVPLTGGPVTPDDLIKQLPNLAQCEVVEVLREAPLRFNLLGLDFSNIKNGGICLNSDDTVCIVGAKLADIGGRVDFGHARLEDRGRLSRLIGDKLSAALPGLPISVSELKFEEGSLLVEAAVNLPGLSSPVQVPIKIGGDGPMSPDLRKALVEEIQKQVKGKSGTWGAVTMKIDHVNDDDNGLWVKGNVSFQNIPEIPVYVRILPSIEVKADALGPSVIDGIFHAIAAMNWGEQDKDSTPSLLVGPDYSLTLRVPILATVPIGAFDGIHTKATLEASPGKGLVFAGPVTVSLPIWIPMGEGVDIGDLTAMIDLSSPRFGIGASVALTPGGGTNELLAFKGTVTIEGRNSSVLIEGNLDALAATLMTAKGNWQTREGVLRIDSQVAFDSFLPFPKATVVVDGSSCALAGTAGVNLAGITGTGSAAAILPSPCGGRLSSVADVAAIESKCVNGSALALGNLCLIGNASLGNIVSANIKFSSPILRPLPRIFANFSLFDDIGKVQVAATSAAVKLSANILFLDVSLYLPTLEGVSAQEVADLLKSLLRPSIDLDALLHGNIQISPSGGDKGNEATASGNGGGDSGESGMTSGSNGNGGGTSSNSLSGPPGSDERNKSKSGNMNSSSGGQQTQSGNNRDHNGTNEENGSQATQGRGGSAVQGSVEGDDSLDWEAVDGWAGAWRLVWNSTKAPYPDEGSAYFTKAEMDAFAPYYIIPNAKIGYLSERRPFILVCRAYHCTSRDLTIVPLLRPPDEHSLTAQIQNLPELGDVSIPIMENGSLVSPVLANYLSSALASGKKPILICLDTATTCQSVLVETDTGWVIYVNIFENPVDPQSLMGVLLQHCTQGCGRAATAALVDAYAKQVLGFYQLDSGWLAILFATPDNQTPESLIYQEYDGSLNPGRSSTITIEHTEVYKVRPYYEPPKRSWWAAARVLITENSNAKHWFM
jgi:hypothetical protein